MIGVLAALLWASAGAVASESPEERFRGAGELLRSGDAPRAVATYQRLAAEGHESASLYWNWAQAASTRGANGEALWALLRAREVDPGDAALEREIARVREAAGLDPAELQPEPLGALARVSRRLHLDLLALGLAALSLGLHAWARFRGVSRRVVPAGWTAGGLALLVGLLPIAGSMARPTAVVVARGAPLLESASPGAEPVATLREGEVVPVLEASAGFARVEEASGARGWARAADLRRLDLPPVAPPGP